MRLGILFFVSVLTLVGCSRTPVANPDPNHTHADFAVWIDGKQLDFSGSAFMSGSSTDESSHPTEGPRKYLHLHDGIGHVIHRHKPGLTLLEFFRSIGVGVRIVPSEGSTILCLTFPQIGEETCESPWRYFDVYTNDPAQGGAQFLRDDYLFSDEDSILITIGDARQEGFIASLHQQWLSMTSDACLYSQTCPWRGDPPTENCIADPEVPCVQ